MDTTETHEPSYYEVALTNRQVLVAFVVLLSCLLVAFLSGVWVGRGAEPARAAAPSPAPAPPAGEPIEQLSFFSGKEPGARTAPRPAAPAPAPEPASAVVDEAADSMRRTLEAEMEANRERPSSPAPAPAAPAPAAPAPAATSTPVSAGERTTRTPPAASPAPATRPAAPAPAAPPAPVAPATAPQGKVWIQVYSSSNGVRAREIVDQLKRANFTAVLGETTKDGQTVYRVRVGPYEKRERAERVAERLRREHRLDTWVTDAP